MNHADVAPLLADVQWDLHPGPLAPQGDSYVETREEFAIVGAARLPIVRAACESGRFDAIVMLGGGDPGVTEAREIGRRYNIPVTGCALAQMHIATMLGNRFSVIDISEVHNMHYYNLVVQYRFTEKCASIALYTTTIFSGGMLNRCRMSRFDASDTVRMQSDLCAAVHICARA